MALGTQPRFPLGTLPTPLQEARRLRAALGGERRGQRLLLKRDDLSIEMVPEIKDQIDRLQQPKQAKKKKPAQNEDEEAPAEGDDDSSSQSESGATPAITNRLDHLEELIEQLSNQLKSMESRLPAQPQQQSHQ